MKPTIEIQEAWAAEVEASGLGAVCKEAGINSRTLNKGLSGGELRPYIYNAINAAVLKLKRKREKVENELITDDGN
jgi:hypothetical protein